MIRIKSSLDGLTSYSGVKPSSDVLNGVKSRGRRVTQRRFRSNPGRCRYKTGARGELHHAQGLEPDAFWPGESETAPGGAIYTCLVNTDQIPK